MSYEGQKRQQPDSSGNVPFVSNANAMRDNGGGYSAYHAGLGAGQVKPRTTDQGTTTNLTLQGGTQTFGAAEPKKVPIPWLLIGALARTVFDTGNIPANEFLNHYTTLAGWKGILSAGFISTSRDKFVYLTSNYFPSGSLARSALSLNQTPTLRLLNQNLIFQLIYFVAPYSNKYTRYNRIQAKPNILKYIFSY